MEFNFNEPQRQSAAGIIIMAASTLKNVVKALAFPLIIFLAKVKQEQVLYVILINLAILLLIFLYTYFDYRKFTFFLDQNRQEFIINKGVFNRTQITVQLDKIQQVNINQSLLQKLIGVYSLQIDTPGSEKKEISIPAIHENAAYSLKARLLHGKNEIDLSSKENYLTETKNIPFLKLGVNTLFKVGLTSNYGSSIALLIGFSYGVFHNIKELLRAFDHDNGQVEDAIQRGINIVSIGILVAVILFVLLLINVIRTFVKYYDFEISKHSSSLLISAGLFAKKNTLLSPNKVQITSYSQNYFQKKFNFLNMQLKQAHGGKVEDHKDQVKTNLEVPGCSPTERDQILHMILGDIPSETKVFIPNFRFINLPILFNVLIPFGIFMIFYTHFQEVRPYLALAIAYGVLAILMIYISYRRHKLMINKDFIIKKSGIWDISHDQLFAHKIQSITTFQYPWHKSLDIGHLDLHTAAGVIRFKYGNYSEIKQLVNYWLYEIESGSEEWM